jgi:hypothetical protein
MIQARSVAVLVASAILFLTATTARSAEIANAADIARFIAGMAPAADSPLTPLTRNPGWQQHARTFDASFDAFEKRQLSKVRAWAGANLTAPKPVLFYMFSGPDFLYANAFFPNATTYVLSGLEPVGQIPDLFRLSPGAMSQALGGLRNSLRSVLTFSFFITAHMKGDLHGGALTGTLPVLYVFLARTGQTIQEVTLVALDDQGEVTANTAAGGKRTTRGVKIVFSGADRIVRTLYYFSTNLADDGFKIGGFSKFVEKLNGGDSFLKSASYLMHGGGFSQVRKFLLDHSARIVQDDSGIPLAMFDMSKWQVTPFGNYLEPIPTFPGVYQPKMKALFKANQPAPIDFGIGYRWRPNQSNLLVATRKDVAAKP